MTNQSEKFPRSLAAGDDEARERLYEQGAFFGERNPDGTTDVCWTEDFAEVAKIRSRMVISNTAEVTTVEPNEA